MPVTFIGEDPSIGGQAPWKGREGAGRKLLTHRWTMELLVLVDGVRDEQYQRLCGCCLSIQ